jgi:hypothetical protein
VKSSFCTIAVVLATWPALAAGARPPLKSADDERDRLYEQAVAAVQAGRPDAALAYFKQVLSMTDETHSLYGVTLYGAGRAASMIETQATACEGAEFYTRYVGLAQSEPAKRTRAVKDLPGLQARCDATEPLVSGGTPEPDLDERLAAEPPPPAHSSNTSLWRGLGWAGVGAGVLSLGVGAYFWSETFNARDAAAGVAPEDSAGYKRHVADLESANASAVGLTLTGAVLSAAGTYLLVWPPE